MPSKTTTDQSVAHCHNVLINTLKSDIEEWLKSKGCDSKTKFFHSEADLQVRLAKYLADTRHYDEILPEYKVPQKEFEERLKKKGFAVGTAIYPWESDMRVDIVVVKGHEYVPVEIKYATAAVTGESLFGDPYLTKKTDVLKDQAASNLVMYNYWKDVRRIEMLTSSFDNVKGGITVIVSNNHIFWDGPQKDKAAYRQFATAKGRTVGSDSQLTLLRWEDIKPTSKTLKDYPEFYIEGRYKCDWEPMRMIGDNYTKNLKFQYMINVIKADGLIKYLPHHFIIDNATTVGMLKSWFTSRYGLCLHIYLKNRLSDNNIKLVDIGATPGVIQFKKSVTVEGLLRKFKERGLKVAVFTSDDWVEVLSDITIENAAKIPPQSTKDKMQTYRNYITQKDNNNIKINEKL